MTSVTLCGIMSLLNNLILFVFIYAFSQLNSPPGIAFFKTINKKKF